MSLIPILRRDHVAELHTEGRGSRRGPAPPPARSPAPGGTVPEIRARLRPLLLLLACAVALTSVSLTSAAGPAAAGSGDRIDQVIKRMTLPEKVGQLFVTYAY